MTKIGTRLYNTTMHAEEFLSCHMWLWWILNFTWGIVYTIIAAFIALFILIFKKPVISKFHEAICFIFGNNWGGLEGVFFIFVADKMGDSWTLHTKQHELGHSFQNAIFGPLNLFLTLIPSAIRYWYIKLTKNNTIIYDAIWFEKSATDAGKAYDEFCKKNSR